MNPALFETFFRDGSYALDFGFTCEHVRRIGGAMEEAGFPYVEVGHGYGLGAARKGYPPAAETDKAYLQEAARTFKKTTFGVFFIPGVGTLDDISMATDHGIGFISIGQNITAIEEVREAVLHSKKLGLHVTVCLLKAHVLPLAAFSAKVKTVQSWNPDAVCVMDSAGAMVPREVEERVELIKGSGSAGAAFHGHDNLALATANSLAAAEKGAVRVDVSLGGFGRSSGNARTEVLVALLEKRGIATRPDLSGTEAVLAAIADAGITLPHPPDMTDILLGLHGLHSSITGQLDRIARRHGIAKAFLYEAVARENPVNPSEEEMEATALRLREGRKALGQKGN